MHWKISDTYVWQVWGWAGEEINSISIPECLHAVSQHGKTSSLHYRSSTAWELIHFFYITLLLIPILIVACVSVLCMVCHHQTCHLSLIQSETQAIAPSKIRLQSEKEWENSKTYCCNFKQLYIYYYFQISLYNRLPHLRLAVAGLATVNHITIPCMCSLLSYLSIL